MNQTILLIISSFLALFLTSKLISRAFNRYYIFFRYKEILVFFELFMDKSYDMVYQNSLITYLSNGYKDIPYQEKETAERNFIKQTFLLMGSTNKNIVTNFFGSEETMMNYMIVYFRKKFSQDGLATIVENESKNQEK